MGIISTIKTVLGLEEGEAEETRVAVEREPDAASERAVKEPETGETEDGDGTDETTTTEGSAETDEGSTAASDEATEGATEGEPVEEIKGIGPAYAGRLAEAGVESVADLAGADAEELAAETDISETRIEGWIERARAR